MADDAVAYQTRSVKIVSTIKRVSDLNSGG